MTQYIGANIEQDGKWTDKMSVFKQTLDFSRVLKKKIDFSRVKLEVIKPWISRRMIELMGFEDEIVINYVFSMLEQDKVDPKEMQIYLTGFMEDKARPFMKELWLLLNDAQKSDVGIPKILIEEEKQRLKMEQETKELQRLISQKVEESAPPRNALPVREDRNNSGDHYQRPRYGRDNDRRRRRDYSYRDRDYDRDRDRRDYHYDRRRREYVDEYQNRRERNDRRPRSNRKSSSSSSDEQDEREYYHRRKIQRERYSSDEDDEKRGKRKDKPVLKKRRRNDRTPSPKRDEKREGEEDREPKRRKL